MISLQFKTDIARESRAISVFTCSDITRDRCPLYQIVKDTSKIDNGYQLFQPAFGLILSVDILGAGVYCHYAVVKLKIEKY